MFSLTSRAAAISIHSLRVEGDVYGFRLVVVRNGISIHSLRVEGDGKPMEMMFTPYLFQSTPSAWRETQSRHISVNAECISIHSLRVEGDLISLRASDVVNKFQSTPSAWRETTKPFNVYSPKLFQSTPSAWRETGTCPKQDGLALGFQSTPSAWRETIPETLSDPRVIISIHSLRVEGDL